jgi:hypothetical protein
MVKIVQDIDLTNPRHAELVSAPIGHQRGSVEKARHCGLACATSFRNREFGTLGEMDPETSSG